MNNSTAAPNSASTCPSLLMRAEQGEHAAWQQMVQLYGPLVYTWARKSKLRAEDAADVVQETMLAVSKGLPRFDPLAPDSSFRGWLRRITRNKCVDFIRKAVDHPAQARGGSTNMQVLNQDVHAGEDSLARELTSAGPDDLAAEQKQVIGRAMALMRTHFEKTTWQAFWRTAVDGCSPDEVAEELGLSRWNVYKARSRVLQRLRTDLSGLEDLD